MIRKGSTLPEAEHVHTEWVVFLTLLERSEKIMAYAIEWPLERVGWAAYTVRIIS